MRDDPTPARVQYAALPFKVTGEGRVRVLLVTSKGGRRWVVPKGSPIRGLAPAEVAAREAYEETGVIGQVLGRRPVGSYRYVKRSGKKGPFSVLVFLMDAERQLDTWPERRIRRTAWFDPAAAARVVDAEGLAEILRAIARDADAALADVLTGPAVPLAEPEAPRSRKALALLSPLAS
ncbi:MAG TPA: NUDIX hydrolase [Acetobacteraceae bacterium]|jgi:8-oxo-dGTP pyrophosphatase MutT (NUDIX family)|nr:NUDIX hydrolase [Acetobacteraceae bacterium]